ncbi:bifunctional aldolase/short-chain dehydrogenase [Pelagibacterium montanilacus]|uniref:bifunctional aldolase/short-chain dehydrogenase n=1 Tax=Pelagibacterium montanilacus TaxID=2185280 RepID=UPI000F8D76A5|nr:bifunctional aldolase/short-chain dehydrogenase [Pelagibacterium montanilacus]
MDTLYDPKTAQEFITRYAERGINADWAERVYTTRLLGGEPRLVLHGGGNTSVKTTATDLVGETWDVLCVKGSGWDMGVIEPEGLPAVKLGPLLKARALDTLSDEDMVALQRANLIDPGAPNPSVETLLHAFLPHKFVDHTHSTAILALVDQDDSRALCEEVYGKRLGFVPYIMPGFALAKAAAEVYDADPTVEGLLLDKHGIFTFGDTAKQAYDRMIAFVSMAEERIARGKPQPFVPARLPAELASPRAIAPMLRGALAIAHGARRFDRMVLSFRTSDAIRALTDAENVEELARRGVSTPDLSIRIKTGPMVLPAPERAGLADYRAVIEERVSQYCAAYEQYFATNDARDDVARTMLDPMPRLVLVPGLGMFGVGRTQKEAGVAADVGEMWVEAVRGAEAVARFSPVTKPDLFDLEYWSLEQAKLKGNAPKPLTGQVALVTGGAGAIGAATAALLAANGAHVAVLDLDGAAAQAVAKRAGNGAIGLECDVTDPAAIAEAIDAVIDRFGGLDIVVSNAGAAFEGAIGTVDDALLRRSFELNFFAHQNLAKAAVAVMAEQKTGGALLFNASKQAVNPGANFGAYGLPKAATLFLSRQYALEYGALGIRANAVNADRIRSGLLTPEMIESRSKARGLSVEQYLGGNLLGVEVTAEDVARAFLHHALADRTTADVTTVDGGNIAAALR